MGENGKRATIREVAAMANVAQSTVSFVLNNTKGQRISEETRQRVLSCAQALGYRPHYLARSIRSGSPKTLGVVSTYRVNSLYFLSMMNGVIDAANEDEYAVLICPGFSQHDQSTFVQYFQDERIDGVVFISSAHSEEKSHEKEFIELFQKHDIPFSAVYSYTQEPSVHYATVDCYQDSYNACDLLLQRGCKRVVYIGSMDKSGLSVYHPATEREHERGYAERMAQAGLSANILHFSRRFMAEDRNQVLALLKDLNPDGLIGCWATFGIQLIDACQQLGFKVPRDVRIISLDSLPYLDVFHPSLSTIRLPFYEMAYQGTRMLIRQLIGTDAPPELLKISGFLEERESTV